VQGGLVALDNFIAAPHIGSATRQTAERAWACMAAQNVLAVLRGEQPAGVVNPLVYADVQAKRKK
jgi:glyoxylate reductase